MENENKETIIDTAKVMTTEQKEQVEKIHGNKGKKKNFTPEQLENKKKKMREAWDKKKATQTTNQ